MMFNVARTFLPLSIGVMLLLAVVGSLAKFTHIALFYQLSLHLFEASLVAVAIALLLSVLQAAKVLFRS